jgi:hypothetical protein
MVGEAIREEALARIGSLYCGIMDEVAKRLDAIGRAVAEVEADPEKRDAWEKCEFAYLQIRKSVEYVALALLAVHQEHEYESGNLENEYKADVIFHDLRKLNPHGFPRALQLPEAQEIDGEHHLEPIPTLSKRRIKKIYDDCAVHLHSGTLGTILRQEVPPYDLVRVAGWRNELESLLSQHLIFLPHVGLAMLAHLRDEQTGKARVVFGQADGPLQVEGDPTVYNDNPQ